MDSPDPVSRPSKAREIFRTTSIEDEEVIGNRIFHPHSLHPITNINEFVFAATSARVGPVYIGSMHYAHAVRVDTGQYENWYHVNIPLSGIFRTLVGDTRVEANVARAAVYGPDVPTAFSGFEQTSIVMTVKMHRRAVEEIATTVFGALPDTPVLLGPTLDVTHGAGATWLKLVQGVFNATAQPNGLHDTIADFLGRTIIEWFLRSTHPNKAEPVLRAAELTVFERAQRIIQESEGIPISLETLAAVSGVTGRTLQSAFRESIGQSPMQYQMALRLSKVRDELRQAAPGSTQVSTVAQQYGFTHLGRFASQYSREFGERPSETLAR